MGEEFEKPTRAQRAKITLALKVKSIQLSRDKFLSTRLQAELHL